MHGAPEAMPRTLHWFKWEAYSTWLTGMALLVLLYYSAPSPILLIRVWRTSARYRPSVSARLYDRQLAALHALCASPLARGGLLLALLLLVLGGALAWGLTRCSVAAAPTFISARSSAPSWSAMCSGDHAGTAQARRALESGGHVDPRWGQRAKLRSTHNTYLTLPLLFIMISNHYPMTYGHELNWLVLLVIVLITAAARQYFVLRHFHIQAPGILGGGSGNGPAGSVDRAAARQQMTIGSCGAGSTHRASSVSAAHPVTRRLPRMRCLRRRQAG
jgi:uncharacterized membrane protein